MKRVGGEKLAFFRALIDAYNDSFYSRDIEALSRLYCKDGDLVYFDNHADCDSRDLASHLKQVEALFIHGKATESGSIEELLIEDLTAYSGSGAALVTATLRYASVPRPAVRATYVLEREGDQWRFRHIHFSFDPSEIGVN